MTFPKVLSVGVHTPGDFSAGGLWTRDIWNSLPSESLAAAMILTEKRGPAVYPFPTEQYLMDSRAHLQQKSVQAFLWPIRSRRAAARTADQIEAFITAQQPDVLLVALHTEGGILVASDLLKRPSSARLRKVGVVWDPPEYHIRPGQPGMTSRWHKAIVRRFYEALQCLDACAVMSDGMAARYAPYTRPITIRHGIPEHQVARAGGADDRECVIGFCGSLYASQEFNALVQALDSMSWRIGERDVRIVHIGIEIRVRTSSPAHITYLGWRSEAEAIQRLRHCHIAYLPYAMDDSFTLAAQMSFPTKLSTYVAAQIPILFHGPADSTVRRFFDRYALGVGCHTNAVPDIAQALQRILLDDDVRSRADAALRMAFEQEFSMTQFQSRLAQLLGVDPALLTAIEP